mmetsp:Transcript_43688/g.91467  ORF Transcript_43688/g.91467 Transcript_43688/m.91467 type:complete len:121 (+) Transcript_43688:771-1133(+)
MVWIEAVSWPLDGLASGCCGAHWQAAGGPCRVHMGVRQSLIKGGEQISTSLELPAAALQCGHVMLGGCSSAAGKAALVVWLEYVTKCVSIQLSLVYAGHWFKPGLPLTDSVCLLSLQWAM